MDDIIGAVKSLEVAFGGEGGSGSGSVSSKVAKIEECSG